MMTLQPSDTIDVDGVRMLVKWGELDTGTSFFIPCIDTKGVRKQVNRLFKTQGWRLMADIRIERGYFGIRIWRVL